MDIAVEIYEQHCGEASLLWLQRDYAVCDAAYDVHDLAELDGRLEAHLDALRLGGDAAWEVCRDALESAEAGEAFVAAALTIHRRDLPGVAHVLDMASGPVDAARGIASALGWVPLSEARQILPGLLYRSCPPGLHYLGIAGAAAQRTDPGETLGYALYSDDLRLRARALRAVGECMRTDLLPDVVDQLSATDDASRFAAAWSAALMGDPSARMTLFEVARKNGVHAARACDLWMRVADVQEANLRLADMKQDRERAPVAIAGARALGDPAHVPWLIDKMGDAELARAAGDAFAAITGVDLATTQLHGPRLEKSLTGTLDGGAIDEEIDPEQSLAWPDAARVKSWWALNARRFPKGTRHILGKAVERAWLERVLDNGSQPLRAIAALELTLLEPGRPLAEVRAPGFRQLVGGQE